MRLALVFLMLLAGCLQQQAGSQSPPVQALQNETQLNITNESTGLIAEGNITIQPPSAETNETGEGANETQAANVTASAVPSGILFTNSTYLLVLDDVSVSPEACGIFSVRHAENGSVIDRLLICPPDSQNWLSPEGSLYRIYVVKVAAGYTGEKWAKVFIFG